MEVLLHGQTVLGTQDLVTIYVLGYSLLVVKAGLLPPAGLGHFGDIEQEKDFEALWLVLVCPTV
jgi:hypothetical protein